MPRYREEYTLFKRGKYWYFRTYDRFGIRTTAHSTGQTNKLAARDWMSKHIVCGLLTGDRYTYAVYAKDFFEPESLYAKVHKIKPNTINVYRSYHNGVLIPYFGNMKLSDITTTELERFVIMLETKYSASATSIIMQTLHKVIQAAIKERILLDDPYKYLEWKPESRTMSRDAFSMEEIRMMVQGFPELAPAITFLALTGLRIGEYLGYDMSCLKESKGMHYLRVDRIMRTNGEIQMSTKTSEVRDVPLCPELISIAGSRRWSYNWYAKRFREAVKLCEGYKERNLSIHSIRHFFVTSTKTAGVNPVMVEASVGHSLRGMAQVYTHIKVEDMEEIINWQIETLKGIQSTN